MKLLSMHWKSAWPVCLHNKYLKEDDCFILKLCSFLYKLFVNDKEFTLAECKCFQMQTIFIFFLLSLTACTHVLNVNRINNNKKICIFVIALRSLAGCQHQQHFSSVPVKYCGFVHDLATWNHEKIPECYCPIFCTV